MWCFARDKEDASLEADEVSREKRAATRRTPAGKRKKPQGIRRLPTFLERNKKPPVSIFEHAITTAALLGVQQHDQSEIKYIRRISAYLAQAYSDACGRREKLTRSGFIDFLRTVQGEDVGTNPPRREDYTCAQFLEEWYMGYGLKAQGELRPDQKDLSMPISNYFISSSHNTYLEGHQIVSHSSAKIYKKVLSRHCRCIEIDVWDGDKKINLMNNRSRSRSPDPNHKRHLSSASLPAYETVKQRLFPSTPRLHHRQASAAEPIMSRTISAQDSSTSGSSSDTLGPDSSSEHYRQHQANHNKKEPLVMHAFEDARYPSLISLTTPVGFREVCKAVKESAFSHGNHLPVIVSLEVHARLEQQEVMVQIMREEWAGYLLEAPLDGCDPYQRQPRPEQLLDKILVKVKRPDPKPGASTPRLGGSTPRLESTARLPGLAVSSEDSDELYLSEDERCSGTGRKKRPVSESLGALAIYTHSEHYESLSAPSARTPSHVFSIVDEQIVKLYEKDRAALLRHNRHYMMRAYPEPVVHMKSDNPDPSIFWRKGVQMVALNWQDHEYDNMALHDAMFTPDTQGYVLKPRGFRSTDGDDDKPDYRTLTLRITVYRGMEITTPQRESDKDDASMPAITSDGDANKHFKPSVQVDLFVSHGKTSGKLVQKTVQKTPPKETQHPDWGPHGHVLEFVGVEDVVEELSFVRFKIRDESTFLSRDKDQVAAWACVRLDRLRKGYRLVDLTDCKGNASDGKLFVKIEKKAEPRQHRTGSSLLRRKTMKWWDTIRAGGAATVSARPQPRV